MWRAAVGNCARVPSMAAPWCACPNAASARPRVRRTDSGRRRGGLEYGPAVVLEQAMSPAAPSVASFHDLAAPGLDFRPRALARQAALLRAVGGLGRPPYQWRLLDGGYEFLQPQPGVAAVHLLAAVALGLDDDDTFVGDPVVAQRQQAFFH